MDQPIGPVDQAGPTLREFRDYVSGDRLYVIGPPADNVLIVGQDDVILNGTDWLAGEVGSLVARYLAKTVGTPMPVGFDQFRRDGATADRIRARLAALLVCPRCHLEFIRSEVAVTDDPTTARYPICGHEGPIPEQGE